MSNHLRLSQAYRPGSCAGARTLNGNSGNRWAVEQPMRNKRILITGGAGLVGSHIADLVALERPREIIILDNFVRGRLENLRAADAIFPLTIVEGDIRDRSLLERTFKGVDIVFHQAAIRITQ